MTTVTGRQPTPTTPRGGSCRTRDPNLWFPDERWNGDSAKRICLDCPVRAACLQYALALQPAHGIWAGLEPHQLRALTNPGGDTPAARSARSRRSRRL